MPIQEVMTKSMGSIAGRELLEPTGIEGNTFESIGDWLVDKMKAGVELKDITNSVIVIGHNTWFVFEEKSTDKSKVIRTVFVPR